MPSGSVQKAIWLLLAVVCTALLAIPGCRTNSSAPQPRPTRVFVSQQARTHPELPWPHWAVDEKVAWTITGTEGGAEEGLVGSDGSFQPPVAEWSLTPWVWDRDQGRLYSPDPETVKIRLTEGYLPIIEAHWTVGNGLLVICRFFTWALDDSLPRSYASYVVKNATAAPKVLRFYLALQPFAVNRWVHNINEMTGAEGKCAVNGRLACLVQPAGKFGTSSAAGRSVGYYALRGKLPRRHKLRDETGLGTGAFAYDWEIPPGEVRQVTLSTVGPAESMTTSAREFSPDLAAQASRALSMCKQYWRERLNQTHIELPDPRVVDAFKANLAYILLLMDGDEPHPGPTKVDYERFYTRDTAYIVAALLRCGLTSAATRAAEVMRITQKTNGHFAAQAHEWDTQGQGIYTAVECYRFTRDKQFARNWWPSLLKAAEFLITLREPPSESDGAAGILRPSISAEDLGPSDQHHYWDDFWGIKGLTDAAYLAEELALHGEARRLREAAHSLEAATWASIRKTCEIQKINFIPNGPEDWTSSAMARGTSPAVWPGQLVELDHPLIRSSFDTYWERWIAPDGGGYRHTGNKIWGYGLELANCYALLHQPDRAWQILQWYLDHQTLPGAYAWAEVIDPNSYTYSGGDMPHGWVAADYINLVRSCIAYEQANTLVLCAGLPTSVILASSGVRVRNLPTYFGDLDMAISAEDIPGRNTCRLRLLVNGKCSPPDGFILKLPDDLEIIRIAPRRRTRILRGNRVKFERGTKEIQVTLTCTPDMLHDSR